MPVIVTGVGLILSEIKTTEGVGGFAVGRVNVQVTVPVDENTYHPSLLKKKQNTSNIDHGIQVFIKVEHHDQIRNI